VVGVEQWAEIRRMYFVGRLSIKEIVRRSGHGRNTVRRALRSGEPPVYRRPPRASKLDPFRDEIDRLLRSEPRLPGKRVRELLEEQGYEGSKTILDDYLRETRVVSDVPVVQVVQVVPIVESVAPVARLGRAKKRDRAWPDGWGE